MANYSRPLTVPVMLGLLLPALFAWPANAQQDQSRNSPYQLLMTPTRVAALVKAYSDGLNYVPGEVLVKFKDGTSSEQQQSALRSLRSRPTVDALRWLGDVAILTDPAEDDALILAARLSQQPEVEYAEPNYIHRKHKTPNDPGFSARQWNFDLIDMPRAWDVNAGATANVKVAVLDSGLTTVNTNFTFPTWNGRFIQLTSVPFKMSPEIDASRISSDAHDFVFWDGPVLDMEGHGTHVSSTIGEDTNDGSAEAGIAYNVTLMPLKICWSYWEVQFAYSAAGNRGYVPLGVDGCDTAAEAAAIRYAADHGASVLNMSVGGVGRSTAVLDALKYAVSKGVFAAISSGNGYEDGNVLEYPSGFAPQVEGVMSVAAVGRSAKHAHYSTSGPQVEIAAPGGDDRDGAGDGLVWQATIYPLDSDPSTVIFPRFDRYAEVPEEGTSMASPHIAGVAALIFSQGVNNPAAIEALIKGTAKDLGASGRDDLYGFGLVQPRVALRGQGVAK